MAWYTYKTQLSRVEYDLTQARHVLLAGASGSGKSVLVHRFIRACCGLGYNLVLLDPKHVELHPYAHMANVCAYAEEAEQIIQVLQNVCSDMDARYRFLLQQGLDGRNWSGPHTWIIVEEYADLTTDRATKARVEPLVQRIAQLGRAAGYHLLIATQRPTSDVITGRIKTNLDTRVALQCSNRQESRNIVETAGAELLQIGQAIVRTGAKLARYNIPYMDQAEEANLIRYMTPAAC